MIFFARFPWAGSSRVERKDVNEGKRSDFDRASYSGEDARRLGWPNIFAEAFGWRNAGADFNSASSDFNALGAFFLQLSRLAIYNESLIS